MERFQQLLHGQVLDLVEAQRAFGRGPGHVARLPQLFNLLMHRGRRRDDHQVLCIVGHRPVLTITHAGYHQRAHQLVNFAGPNIGELIRLRGQAKRFVERFDQFLRLCHMLLPTDQQDLIGVLIRNDLHLRCQLASAASTRFGRQHAGKLGRQIRDRLVLDRHELHCHLGSRLVHRLDPFSDFDDVRSVVGDDQRVGFRERGNVRARLGQERFDQFLDFLRIRILKYECLRNRRGVAMLPHHLGRFADRRDAGELLHLHDLLPARHAGINQGQPVHLERAFQQWEQRFDRDVASGPDVDALFSQLLIEQHAHAQPLTDQIHQCAQINLAR